MGTILKLLALGGLGYAGSRWLKAQQPRSNTAYADGRTSERTGAVRDAGPKAMRDQPKEDWSGVDEASDQSFPASDPPSTY